MNAAPCIALTNLVKEYGLRRVLDIDSLRFEHGKTYALTGHNGSGKTTLLRIIAGLEAPTHGQVELGVDRNRIGFCFQRPYMFRGTVRKNIVWGLGKDYAHDTIVGMAERLKVSELLDRSARRLSAGEMQKVSLARMLVCKPLLLLLDEPTTNLDAAGTAAVEQEIRRFADDGGTCIVATHMADHAFRLGASVIRLEAGKTVPGETINMFDGIVDKEEDTTIVRVGGTAVCIRCAGRSQPGKIRICVAASDVVLSHAPLDSSMQNSFAGTVTALRQSNGIVETTVDIGIPLTVLLTFDSVTRLHLSLGSTVTASFKATAVKIL